MMFWGDVFYWVMDLMDNIELDFGIWVNVVYCFREFG